MSKNRNKLHFVRGTCELEKGIVKFIGGMSGVSYAQTWYHVIYAIKDKFKEIDFWIDPQLEECFTLPSTYNHLRYGICKSFKCTYEPFPEGVVKPKRKLSSFDKENYDKNRAKAILGVEVETLPQLPTFTLEKEYTIDDIHKSIKEINDILDTFFVFSDLPEDYDSKLLNINISIDTVRLHLPSAKLDLGDVYLLKENYASIHSQLVKLISKINVDEKYLSLIVSTSQTCSNCWNLIKILEGNV